MDVLADEIVPRSIRGMAAGPQGGSPSNIEQFNSSNWDHHAWDQRGNYEPSCNSFTSLSVHWLDMAWCLLCQYTHHYGVSCLIN
jgi:hypothetical protein